MSGPMTEPREVLAEAILAACQEEGRRFDDGFEWYGSAIDLADRLIAAGVTLTPSLDEGLLARALHRAYCRDNRPMHSAADHSAAAIAAEYRRLAQEGETST